MVAPEYSNAEQPEGVTPPASVSTKLSSEGIFLGASLGPSPHTRAYFSGGFDTGGGNGSA